MTPAERYDWIIQHLVWAADDLQNTRKTGNPDSLLSGQDSLAIAEFHADQLQKECPKINLHGTIDFDKLL